MKPQIASFWRIWFKHKEKYDYINRTDVRWKIVRKYIYGKNILDFGFGTGYFLKKLSTNNNFCLYGIDLYKKPKDLPKNVKIHKIRDLNELKSLKFTIRFDTIIASEVLEHLAMNEIKKLLQFFRKWISKEGRIIFTIPYEEKIITILCPYCLRWFHPWLHRQSFNEKILIDLLEKEKFDIYKKDYITIIDFWSIPECIKTLLKTILLKFFKQRFQFIVWIIVVAQIKSNK